MSTNHSDIRLPPHSIEAEQSLLGGLLVNNRAWDNVADLVREDDFYRDDHRRIFHHITSIIEEGKPADVLTVFDVIQRHGDETKTGGIAYLGEIAGSTPSAANIRRYGEIIREYAVLRQLVSVGEDIATSALNPAGQTAQKILDAAESKVFQVAEKGQKTSDFQPLSALLTGVHQRAQALAEAGSPDVTGTPTGFKKLDELTSGLQESDLIIVAGRPSMGKTALALNVAEYVAAHAHLPVGIFSMEMSASQLALRLLSSASRVDQQKVRRGKLNDEEWGNLTQGLARLKDVPLFIDETPNANPFEVRARARRLHRKYGKLGLIIVDYLQLMNTTGSYGQENRATEISEISRALKSLAKELQVPVMALSQLNRELERRPDKRPVMSDLRESGAIEQDADLILFIYRDEIYNPESPDKGVAEINIGKQRNGPLGRVHLSFMGHLTRFNNLERYETPQVELPSHARPGHMPFSANPTNKRPT